MDAPPLPALPLLSRAAVTVGALMAARRIETLPAAGEALVAEGVSPADLREAAYIASLFCGFPTGVAALVALASLPSASEPALAAHHDAPPATRQALRARGEEVFRTIHRVNAARQLAMLEGAHADFADTVVSEAYGRVIARDFLPLDVRELIAIACLAVLDLRPQLRGHLLACRNCGASWQAIHAALELACTTGTVDPAPARALATELAARDTRSGRDLSPESGKS